MSYRIATFNIRKFSRQAAFENKDGNRKKDLETIAQIIRENCIDIIAIQEILHKEALKELLETISGQYAEADRSKRGSKEYGSYHVNARMSDSYGYRTKHWEGRWAIPISNFGNGIAEGYAYIWNRDRIKLVTNLKGESFEPRIADAGNVKNLVRPPFLGRFMPINGRFEFRLINTHIVYSVPSKKIDEDEDSAADFFMTGNEDVQLRKKEFRSLIDTIFISYSEKVFDTNLHDREARLLEPFTFVLGDYNLNLNSSAGNPKARFDREDECISRVSKGKLEIVTVNDKLTTLKGKRKSPELQAKLDADPIVEHHLSNNYDHFTYDRNRFEANQVGVPEVIWAFDHYTSQGDETKFDIYRNKISDHLPVYIEIDITRRSK